MIEQRDSDSIARERIRDDVRSTLFVEAAAGSGKTTALTERMLTLLSEGVADVHGIAAVTFTRKATLELRLRMQNLLERALRLGTDEAVRARLRHAVDNIDALFIETIHAFCAAMLREYPLQAGVAPDFAMLEDADAEALRDEAWKRFAAVLDAEHPELLATLEELELSIDDLRSGYGKLCEHPDVDFPPGDDAAPDFAAAVDGIRTLADTCAAYVHPDPKERDALQHTLARAASLLATPPSAARDRRIVGLFRSKSAANVVLKRWTDAGFAKEVRDRLFPEFLTQRLHAAVEALRQYHYARLLPLLHEARRSYATGKQRRNALDNADLLLRARNLLRDHRDVRDALARRWRHVLVDEFQDTDPLQAEILLYLCGDVDDGATWQDARLRPGALFVVGDPKQAIYRFRRADISVYNQLRAIVLRSGGEVLGLTRNFRSLPSICDAVNRVFAPHFPAPGSDMQPAYEALLPERAEAGTLAGMYLLPNEAHADTATALAAWLREAVRAGVRIAETAADGAPVDRPLRYGDVLMLGRTSRQLRDMALALDAAGIPYSTAGGLPMQDNEELDLLLLLLRVLGDPEDEVAMVAFLRSAWCGVDDAALLRWRQAGGRFKLTAAFKEGMDERLRQALDFIKSSMRLVRSMPPGTVASTMVDTWAMLPWLLAQDRGDARAGAFASLLGHVRQASGRGDALYDIMRALERLRQSSKLSVQLHDERDAVRLMTMHGAKGLEAPLVVLLDTDTARSRNPEIIVRRGEAGIGYCSFAKGGNNAYAGSPLAQPREWEHLVASESLYLEAERQRLRYVAATRARNALLLLGHDKGASNFTPDEVAQLAPRPLPRVTAAVANEETHQAAALLPDSPDDMSRTLSQHRDDILRPGWRRLRVSVVAKGADVPRGATRGKGARWGTAVHRMMQLLATDPALEPASIAAGLLAAEGIAAAEEGALLELVNSARTHPLWRRIMAAGLRHCEIPFAQPWTDGEALPGVLRGDIDLAFHDEQGWTIVDYKTDAAGEALDAYVAHYAPQVRLYARAWRNLSGQPARALLWFLTDNTVVDVTEQNDTVTA